MSDHSPRAEERSGPVTMIVTRLVKRGREEAYEDWITGIVAAARGFPGYRGAEVMRPTAAGDREYVVILKFDHYEDAKRWARSDERAAWLARADPLTTGSTNVQLVSGLEAWFTLPGAQRTRPPARWKMAVLTTAALYPLLLLSNLAVQPLLSPIVDPLATLLSTALLVTLMTYVIMPRVTRLFAGWLYPYEAEVEHTDDTAEQEPGGER